MRIHTAITLTAALLALTAWGSETGTAQEQSANCGLYEYRADIRRVVDGDTVDADIDLGFNVWLRNERLRLYRINAPEIKGATKSAGLAAKKALIEKVGGKQVRICTVKDRKGKYGRYLATIWIDGVNVNAWLVSNGFAVWRDY